MIPEFMPIISTKIDWDNFLVGAEKALGRSCSASLDAKNLSPVGQAAFIPVTKEFRKPGTDALKAFRDYSNGLHVYVGFLVVCDKETLGDLPTKHIEVTITQGLECQSIIASGSMYQWYFFLLACLSESAIKNTRILGMKLMLWFERNSLGECWVMFKKEWLDDETYILVAK